ncbi:MAG: DUF423 domain-containing protein [Gemmatimonadota bacterium]|jgi:uncharacterized membrane protein YgdD (TMEM256/DUF423 family)
MPSPGDPPVPGGGRRLFAAGAVLAGLAVALGAFGTHALEARVPTGRVATWETGVRYHLVHALGVMVLGLARARWPSPGLGRAGILLLAGVAVFSGSLYVLVLTDTPFLGAVTPVGGVLLIAGWATAAWSLLRNPSSPPPPPGDRTSG